jgi:hypothetical protein
MMQEPNFLINSGGTELPITLTTEISSYLAVMQEQSYLSVRKELLPICVEGAEFSVNGITSTINARLSRRSGLSSVMFVLHCNVVTVVHQVYQYHCIS